jgi:hypothetical protein
VQSKSMACRRTDAIDHLGAAALPEESLEAYP